VLPTPLGASFARPLLIVQEFDVPVIGAYADASADGLLDAVAGWPPDALDTEVRA
jgi:hypothetical protein